jgi:hypothetical protein
MIGMSERPKIVVFSMRPARAIEIIRRLAVDSNNVLFTEHALGRMNERDITDLDVLRVLCRGTIEGDPAQVAEREWQCKVVSRLKGNRDAGVITIIVSEEKLRIRTVEWEDVR